MLTTKDTLNNLAGTEKVAVSILDRVRSINDHLFGMNAPPDPKDPSKTGEAARGFINQINDQNADIVVVLTRVYKELQFMEETLVGGPGDPTQADRPRSMPRADASGLETELAGAIDAHG